MRSYLDFAAHEAGYRPDFDAINIVYKNLQKDRDAKDITDIIRSLYAVVDEAIDTRSPASVKEQGPYDISKIDFDRLRQEFGRSNTKRSTVQSLKQVIEERLSKLIAQNPLRTDFQHHYEEIVDAYNREKDRATIERTFEALLIFEKSLDDESARAIREGLDEESLALFDLLRKPGLESKDVQRIKKVAAGLLETLKTEKLRVENWREKEATRDAVHVVIENFLWADQTGLPSPAYSEEDVKAKGEEVFRHVYRVYPTVPSPYYTVH